MSLPSIQKAIAAIKIPDSDTTVEILLHPGGSRENEAALWEKHAHFWPYYLSDNREREKALLQGKALSALVKTHTRPEAVSVE